MGKSDVIKKKGLDARVYQLASENWSDAQIIELASDNDLSEDETEDLIDSVDSQRLQNKERTGQPEQLEFFDRAFHLISSKEKKRSLETIVKELVRVGLRTYEVRNVIKLICSGNEELKSAAEAIDR